MASLDEFLAELTYTGEFESRPFYSEDGDFVTSYIKDVPSYGKRVDDILTIYRDIVNDDLVGCQIKGVKAILEKLGKFGVSISDLASKTHIGILFLAYAATTQPNPQRLNDLMALARGARPFERGQASAPQNGQENA